MAHLSFDRLDDTQFEQFCFDLVISLGFTNVNWRKGTGLSSSPSDRGRDIECQLVTSDIDGATALETWFVECKHYKEGVPPAKIQGALAWASSSRPKKLVLIASNFFSNGCKDYLEEYRKENRPPFEIKTWERPDLERLTTGKAGLLKKYGLTDEQAFVSIMHPTHLLYSKSVPLFRLHDLFKLLDQLEDKHRDVALGWLYHGIIQPRMRAPKNDSETMGDLYIDEVSYQAFKRKCLEISELDIIPDPFLPHLIVSYAVQSLLDIGDTTAIDEEIAQQQRRLDFTIEHAAELEQRFMERTGKADIEAFIQFFKDNMREIPKRTERNYEAYWQFCEKVLQPLLNTDYLS
jgi:hypothetical protein